MENIAVRTSFPRRRVKIYSIRVAAFLCSLALSSAAFAQAPAADEADVAIVARSLDAAPNAKLRDIITFAASLRLDREGLASVVLADPSKTGTSPQKLLARIESRKSN